MATPAAVALFDDVTAAPNRTKDVDNRIFKVEDSRCDLTNGAQEYDSKDEINLHFDLSPHWSPVAASPSWACCSYVGTTLDGT